MSITSDLRMLYQQMYGEFSSFRPFSMVLNDMMINNLGFYERHCSFQIFYANVEVSEELEG